MHLSNKTTRLMIMVILHLIHHPPSFTIKTALLADIVPVIVVLAVLCVLLSLLFELFLFNSFSVEYQPEIE